MGEGCEAGCPVTLQKQLQTHPDHCNFRIRVLYVYFIARALMCTRAHVYLHVDGGGGNQTVFSLCSCAFRLVGGGNAEKYIFLPPKYGWFTRLGVGLDADEVIS